MLKTSVVVLMAQFINDPGADLHRRMHERSISPPIQFTPQQTNPPRLSQPEVQRKREWICVRYTNNQVVCREQ